MAGKIITIAFWLTAVFLLGLAFRQSGSALLIPAAVGTATAACALDVYLHRKIVTYDLKLLRTVIHVLSAVTVAASCMHWLARVLVKGRF